MGGNSEKRHAILTVIVPTRDRADTLVHCLRTITAQTNPNMEIIVSDNFSGPEVKKVVDGISDKRLRYIRTSERMGMSEHWNFALEHVTGDWVTVIGDDDGLVPGAVDKFFALSHKHPDIQAITATNCSYRWPTDSNNTSDAKLSVVFGSGYEIKNGRECLKRTMLGEIIHLPTIYTGGFVRKDLIDEIKKKSPGNKFFLSINPDLYSGMAVTSVVNEYIYIREIWGISGTSKHSNGHKHKNKAREEMNKLSLFTEGNIRFLPSLIDGAVESMQILLYECFLQSQHLRSDNMGVTLQQQLEISLLHAPGRVRTNITDYCRDIAKINGIEFEPILKAVNKSKPSYKIKKQLLKLVKHIPGKYKNRKTFTDLGMKNVYDAAGEMKKILA